MQNIAITTQPILEPVTVTETKQFMRVDIADDDDLISDLIVTARQLCEEYTRRKFISTTVTLSLDGFPSSENDVWWNGVRDGALSQFYGFARCIKLPFAPVSSVASITTYNPANTPAVLSSSAYRLDTGGNVMLNDDALWPTDLRNRDAVRIAYVAGYGASASLVPSPIKHAIKLTAAAMYDDRSCVTLPAGAMQMLDVYRVLEERRNGL